jgi:hypothetical protein
MYKLGILSFLVGVVLSTSFSCGVCGEQRPATPAPKDEVVTVGAAQHPVGDAIPNG